MKVFFEIFKVILALVLVLPITAVAVLYLKQDQFIFPVPDVSIDSFRANDFTQVSIKTEDNESLFALHHPSEDGEATILVFHGNGSLALSQLTKGLALASEGFGVLLVEYRGYPGSTGRPSEKGLYLDGVAAYDFVQQEKKQSVGLYAHSLGTAVAVNLATQREVFAVVLEAPFESLMAVAQERFPWAPVSLLLKHKFRSDQLVQHIKAPTFIMHGDNDQVIPIEHGRRLHRKAPSGTEFLTIENAGHNNLEDFGVIERAVKFFKMHVQLATRG